MTVTIGIKALNEARHIDAALRSALAAVEPHGGEVILADSGSTDGTVDIARRLPVRVQALADPAERSCGAGAQLAFQHAGGDWFCLLDGDMTLVPGFVDAALAHLRAHPRVAGVGGQVIERNLETEEFQIRAAAMADELHRRPGRVDRLDGGGLYRTAALREVGWFADRNLHSFEEFELGARLQARGWELHRIAVPSVEHFGHTGGGYRLLWRRITSRQLDGSGEVLRGAIGQPHLRFVLRHLEHLRRGAIIAAWWAALVVAAILYPPALLPLLLLPLGYLSWRRGGVRLGFYSLLLWNATAFGLVRGLLRRRVPADRPLRSVDVTARR